MKCPETSSRILQDARLKQSLIICDAGSIASLPPPRLNLYIDNPEIPQIEKACLELA